ncbi:MAG: aspartate carbamoyltransferase [Chloroflexi bacterium HGW-Chloroflexi-1]|nr:MAG: aspartate carbamoyltransferase [Chloroflexi bacterium HGW-Chloroflexi-1]
MATTLCGKDILRADQFTLDEIELIMDTAARFEGVMRAGGRLLNMAGKVLATLFYEPSTRTRLSFETAMLQLGGQVISVAEAKTSSSAAKGETLFDTGKMIEGYAHVTVIRHPVVGSAAELAAGAGVPVINGGDGAGQHPTQALLDLYTIRKEKGRVEGLTVALAGDLKNGRTAHSLSALLATQGVRFYFVAPDALAMPAEITAGLRARGVEIVETSDLAEAAAQSDVLYMTRIQRERFADPAEYEQLKGAYVVDMALVKSARPGITVMHPLPRVDEIATEVDAYAGAAYFRQAANGVPVRMALMALVTGQE